MIFFKQRGCRRIVKVINGKKYGEIYGVHIAGGMASEVISEPTALIASEITLQEVVAGIIHAYPSYTAAFDEAYADVLGHTSSQKKMNWGVKRYGTGLRD